MTKEKKVEKYDYTTIEELDSYKIKELDDIFKYEGLVKELEEARRELEREGITKWGITIISSEWRGIYQIKDVIELFTDIEVTDDRYKDNLHLFIDEWIFTISPFIDDKLNEKLKDNLKEDERIFLTQEMIMLQKFI